MEHTSTETNTGLSYLIAKNSIFNFSGQVILILLALVVIPFAVPALGDEQFGLLSLVWVIVGYFSLFDLGIGRALTRTLSESIARVDRQRMYRVLWSSILTGCVVGTAISVVLVLVAPAISDTLIHGQPQLRQLSIEAITIACWGVPLVILFGIFRGILASLQQFFLVNGLQIFVGVGQWGGALVCVFLGYGVREILLVTVIVRFLALVAVLVVIPRYIEGFYQSIRKPDFATLRELLGFGGWITVSQVIGQLLAYFDRFIVGLILSLTAVAYYTVPQEALLKFLIVPLSLTNTLFPALTEKTALGDHQIFSRFYQRSFRYLLTLILPLIVLMIVYSDTILRLWMGNDYAANSSVAFQILSIGILFSSLAQLPTIALHASNRPDICAKFHLIEVPVAVILTFALINFMGIEGAAIAWSIRAVLDALLLFNAAGGRRIQLRVQRLAFPLFNRNMLLTILVMGSMTAVALISSPTGVTKYIFAGVVCIIYPAVVWRFCFDETDRIFLTSLRTRFFPA